MSARSRRRRRRCRRAAGPSRPRRAAPRSPARRRLPPSRRRRERVRRRPGPRARTRYCAAGSGTVRLSVTLLARPSACDRARWTVSPRPRTAATSSTGPSAGASEASACGPTSQSAPRSRRQGDSPNGLPGLKIEPSRISAPPSHSPGSTTSRNQLTVGSAKRAVKKTTEATRERSHAATTRSASSTERASGFSSNRWQPASAAAHANSACTSGATAIDTASTRPSSASSSRSAIVPWRCATAAALAGSRPQTPASSTPGCETSPAACTVSAQKPVPISPTRTAGDPSRPTRNGT